PGTGKTMLAVQLSRLTEVCGTVLRPGSAPIVNPLQKVLEGLGTDLGLTALVTARMPLVYVLDGLDQADHASQQKQVIKLFKFVERLNGQARSQNLLTFPIVLLFTVRENVWDRWFTVFEGRNTLQFRQVIPEFTPEQLTVALSRYSVAYDYTLPDRHLMGIRQTLSLPLNLRILSESHQFNGQLEATDVLGEHILAGYVRRKSELLVRLLPWL